MTNWLPLIALCAVAGLGITAVLAHDHHQRRTETRTRLQLLRPPGLPGQRPDPDQVLDTVQHLPRRDIDRLLDGISHATDDPDTNAW